MMSDRLKDSACRVGSELSYDTVPLTLLQATVSMREMPMQKSDSQVNQDLFKYKPCSFLSIFWYRIGVANQFNYKHFVDILMLTMNYFYRCWKKMDDVDNLEL